MINRGADEAGAVFVAVNHLDGTYDLLAPPAGPSHGEDGGRLFRRAFPQPVTWPEINELIARQRKFDPDIWLVEIEDRTGLAGIKPSKES